MKKTFPNTAVMVLSAALILLLAASNGQAQNSDGPGPPAGDFIEHFDTNDDNKISREEFPGPDNHFTRLDQNCDRYIDGDEKPQKRDGHNASAKRRPDPVAMFDRNDDNLISLEEFPGPDTHFTLFDKNEDGFLDEQEMPKGPPPKKRGNQHPDS